jgi:UDP-3-O-[3-hydroxymyristoyl] N-acetylglucosamine deacetylase
MLYSRPDIRSVQCTLNEPIHCVGYSQHSRNKVSMSLLPAPANSGVHFLRRDVGIARALITASRHNVVDTHPYTVLANEYGVSIGNVGNLLAALRGCGVDNVLIEVSSGELPSFDGSSAPLVAMINQAGVVAQGAARHGIWIDHFVAVRSGEHYAFIKPGLMPLITVDGVVSAGSHTPQQLSLSLLDHVFEQEIAPARNPEFNIDGDSRFIASQDPQSVNGETEPRFADEFARYKILECLGFLALAEVPICGQLYIYKPCTFLINALISELFATRDSWRQLSYAKINQLTGGIAATSYQK